MASLQQTQEQRRAKAAWDCVHHEVKEKHDQKWAGEYRALVRSAATDVLTNGLGQTLAFLLSKAKGKHDTPHGALYTHLSNWIANPYPDDASAKPRFEQDKLLEWLIDPKQGSDVYRQITVEVIAYLNWLKRFAEAELPEPKD